MPHTRRAGHAPVAPAGTPKDEPSRLRLSTAVVIGLVIALIVGVILAFLR